MNEMRTLISDTAAKLFADHCDRETRDAAEAGTWPAALWQAAEETGLTLAAAPEAAGGAGGTIGDAMAVLRQAGHQAVPLPLAETFLAAWALAGSGHALPAGPLTVAPVRPDDRPTLTRAGDGWVLSGHARRVPWAAAAGALAVLAEADGAPMVALVPPVDCRIAPGANMAGEPRDDVDFADLSLSQDAVHPAGIGIDAAALYRLGALTRVVLIAGALESQLEMAVQYALDRVQFGRPIARFQAIQQQLADLAGQVAAAGRAADVAVEAVEAAKAGDGALEIAVAKARAGEAAGFGAQIAHQVHGAMGFTREHALHYRSRRLWSWRDEFGDETAWQTEIGRQIAARGADGLWAFMSGT